MNPGKLREKVRIEEPAGVDPATGDQRSGWVPVASVWAEVEDIPGRSTQAETSKSNVRADVLAVRVTIRNRPGITGACRVIQLSGNVRSLQIMGPGAEIKNRAYLVLNCQAAQ